MLSSFLERLRGRGRGHGVRRLMRGGGIAFAALMLAFAALLLARAPAFAAEWYIQPAATITGEGDTNLDLDPTDKTRTLGYLGAVSSYIGVATPDSNTTIRPRLEYRGYPEDSPDNRLEEYLDFSSNLKLQRSSAAVYGSLEHRDEFNAQFYSALYDPLLPPSPTTPETGKALVGGTRDSALVVPSYNYNFSPILSGGVSGIFQKINYTPSDATEFVDFSYYYGKAWVSKSVSPQTDITFGLFGSKYKATHIDSDATGEGGTVDLSTSWSPLWTTTLSLVYEHADITATAPTVLNDSTNTWGATVSAIYKAQVSQFRVDAGRMISPSSGAGALYANDQIRTQYDRGLTERLSVTGALFGVRSRGLAGNVAGNDRSYLQSVVELKWMMAPTWYVQGGYQYMWQKYETASSGAANNRVYITVGYQALGPQR